MNTTGTVKATLSCHHRVEVPATAAQGDLIECPRCTSNRRATDSRKGPARRRIAKFLATGPNPADERDEAERFIRQTAADHAARGADPEAAEAMAIQDQAVEAELAATEVPATYDAMEARNEHRAVKAWKAAGSNGEAPATPNLTAMNAAHAAGRPRTGTTSGTKKATTPRSVHPRKAEAVNVMKAKEGKRGPGRKLTAEELDAYIRKVRATEGTGTASDELEFAYWIESIAVSRTRWMAAWTATDQPAE